MSYLNKDEGFMSIPDVIDMDYQFLEENNDRNEKDNTIRMIKFGEYMIPTDSKPSDIKIWTDCEWFVIKTEEEKALLLAKDCIDWEFFCGDNRLFEPAVPCSWEKSYLRNYLNGELYDRMFTEEEKKAILPINDYSDKMFILSVDELDRYFPYMNLRRADMFFGGEVDDRVKVWKEPAIWWTNTVGEEPNQIAVVLENGSIDHEGFYNDADEVGIRPAMWVDIREIAKLKRSRFEGLFGGM